MKYELKQYVEDKPFVEGMLEMMAAHGVTQRGAENYAPDTTKILTLWKAGVLRLVLMKDDADKVVGYQGWLMSSELHDMTKPQATMFSIYVDQQHRGSTELFEEFVKYSVNAMKILGATKILVGVDDNQPWLRKRFGEVGFTQAVTTTLLYTGE